MWHCSVGRPQSALWLICQVLPSVTFCLAPVWLCSRLAECRGGLNWPVFTLYSQEAQYFTVWEQLLEDMGTGTDYHRTKEGEGFTKHPLPCNNCPCACSHPAMVKWSSSTLLFLLCGLSCFRFVFICCRIRLCIQVVKAEKWMHYKAPCPLCGELFLDPCPQSFAVV